MFIKSGKNEKVFFFQQGFLNLSLCIIFAHIKPDNESVLWTENNTGVCMNKTLGSMLLAPPHLHKWGFQDFMGFVQR